MREIKKLRLNRETIHLLEARDLRQVRGAYPTEANQCRGDSVTCWNTDPELCAPTWATTCGTGYNC